MNHDFLIKTTNRVALYATGALFYWVFAFLTITVFDLKIFRERMTEMFFLSLLGIFAILAGAIVLNVMSNLSKISAAAAPAPAASTQDKKKMSRGLIIVMVSFPLIVAALFGGSHLSAERKERLLVASAERLIAENQTSLAALANYRFSEEYVVQTEAALGVLNKIDRSFPELMVIVPDSMQVPRSRTSSMRRRGTTNCTTLRLWAARRSFCIFPIFSAMENLAPRANSSDEPSSGWRILLCLIAVQLIPARYNPARACPN